MKTKQRTLKFRAWDKERKLMLYKDGGASFDGNDYCELGIINDAFKNSTLIFQQFTGLFDRNGKEIYEGDVVKVGNRIFKIGWYVRGANFSLLTINSTVLASSGVPVRYWNWLDCGAGVYFQKEKKSFACEIIGNDSENPELLQDNN